MKILALETNVGGIPQSRFSSHLKAEASRVWELYRDGIIREMYFRQDWHGAVIMLEAQNVQEAHAILDTLPLVREGLIGFEVIPLGPYTGISRLFAGTSDHG